MNVLCRFGFHFWRYHGIPVERRICKICLHRQYLIKDEWSDHK